MGTRLASFGSALASLESRERAAQAEFRLPVVSPVSNWRKTSIPGAATSSGVETSCYLFPHLSWSLPGVARRGRRFSTNIRQLRAQFSLQLIHQTVFNSSRANQKVRRSAASCDESSAGHHVLCSQGTFVTPNLIFRSFFSFFNDEDDVSPRVAASSFLFPPLETSATFYHHEGDECWSPSTFSPELISSRRHFSGCFGPNVSH